jgi:hypothetical protein
MDETTGLPMVGWPPLPYNPRDYSVPEQYREFLSTRRGIISCYVQDAEHTMRIFHMKVDELLEYFPTWEEVTQMWNGIATDWTEEKHALFKEALEWMDSKNCFMASWSY